MKPCKFRTTRTIVADVILPMSITKAASTLAAICNRDDTPKVIGDVVTGYVIPLHRDVVASILGVMIGHSFIEAMANYAYRDYYEKVTTTLFSVGMILMQSSDCWMLVKLPKSRDKEGAVKTSPGFLYNTRDFADQRPNGMGEEYVIPGGFPKIHTTPSE